MFVLENSTILVGESEASFLTPLLYRVLRPTQREAWGLGTHSAWWSYVLLTTYLKCLPRPMDRGIGVGTCLRNRYLTPTLTSTS